MSADTSTLAGRVAGDTARKPSRRRSKLPGQNRSTYAWLIAPSVVLLILINAYPFIYAAFQSLHNGSLIATGPFVGLQNFAKILSEQSFWDAALFTLIFTVVGVFGSWSLGLVLALLLKSKVPAKGLFRVLLLLPWIVPIVVTSTSWNWLVATSSSPVPTLFHALGLGTPLFLADPALARVMVCLFEVWVNFPFMMMMAGSALTSVDESIYEAALMDGASKFQSFIHMTLPLIARSTYISWVLMTIFAVNDFPTVYLLTGGGPIGATNTLVVLAYRTVFQNFQTGPGVAIAFLMTVALGTIAVLLFRQIRKAHSE